MKKFLIGFFISGLILIGLSTCIRTFAQTLPRKGWFGLGAAPAKNTNAAQEGLSVTLVSPNSTGEELGIKVGDIILAIDGKPMNDTANFVAHAQSKTEGDPIEFTILSNGAKVSKKGTVKGKPKETSPFADVIYDATEMNLGKLRTITYKPKNKTGKLPAVFYIQGLPCQSQELPDAKDPRRQAFEDWVKAGFVVFRVERPNLGDSITTKDCRDIDFNEEVEVNKAGYKKLLAYDFVDNDNIFFFGHSMGGWTAPFIAQMKQPKGIIVYGTGMVSWFEYFIHLYRIQSTYGGETHVAAEKETREMIPMLYEWLEAGKTAEEMRKNPALKAIVDRPGMFEGEYFQGKAFGRSAHFFHTMSKQNLAEAWSKVSSKVLAMYGEFDVQALNANDAVTIAEVVNQSNPGNGEFLLLPKTEHIFAKVESYRQTAELYGTGKFFQYASQNYNPEVGRTTSEWMQKAMKSSSK
ncbi:MAG TPA: PDZ domain-containing protein [Pyrinomonadaceae bacterium]|nr:PDZ domain-containing protein [Pyrinomonadaceae bacterium]